MSLTVAGCGDSSETADRELLARVVAGEQVTLPDETTLTVDAEGNYMSADADGDVLDNGECQHGQIDSGEPIYEQSAIQLIELHAALRERDAEATAGLFRYPVRVQGTDGPAVHVLDEPHFIDRFALLFPPESIDAILAKSPVVPHCARDGASASGGGIVWSSSTFHVDHSFDEIFLAPHVSSAEINEPSPPEQHITDAALRGADIGYNTERCQPPLAQSYRELVQTTNALQEALAGGDPNQVVTHIGFPMRAHYPDRPTQRYETAAELLDDFDEVFTPHAVELLLLLNPADDPICKGEGIGLKAGFVWLWSDGSLMTIQSEPSRITPCSIYQSFCSPFDDQ